MRKTASILLLSVILVAYVGPGLYYPVLTMVHRYKVHAWLKTQQPERFTRMEFSSRQATALQLDDENEFEFEGKKYDIISRKHVGDNTIVYAINDSDEELLYARASGEAGKTNKQLQVIKAFSIVLYANAQAALVIKKPLLPIVEHASVYTNHYTNHSADIISPPPQRRA